MKWTKLCPNKKCNNIIEYGAKNILYKSISQGYFCNKCIKHGYTHLKYVPNGCWNEMIDDIIYWFKLCPLCNCKIKFSQYTALITSVNKMGRCKSCASPFHISDKKGKTLGKFSDVHKAGEFAEEMRQKYYGEFAGKS